MRGFVLFLLVLFAIAALLRVDFFFTIVYLFCAVYLLSRIWIDWARKGLRVRRMFTDHAFLGDRVEVELMLHNTGWLPIPWLQLRDSLPVQLKTPPFHTHVLSLKPREKQRLTYTLYCQQRGYYKVGPLSVRAGDLLGIHKPRHDQASPDSLVVYPKILPLQKLGLPSHSPQVVLPARAPLFRDPSRIMGVRDYQVGDSPRHIHWTATASAGRLLVKQYQPAIARETLICLDLDQGGYGRQQRYTATELAIVVAASLAHHIIVQEGLAVGFATEAWDPIAEGLTRFLMPPRTERAHLMDMLEVLARVRVASHASLSDLLRRCSINLAWGGTLLVITGQESGDLFRNLAHLQRRGLAVCLILVQPTQRSAELEDWPHVLGVPVYRVWREHDLEAIR